MQRSKIVPVIAIVAIVMTTSFDAAGGGGQAASTGDPANGSGSEQQTSAQPNIVLILTDDQRFDELARLPTVHRQLIRRGMNLRRAYVVNSLCCPSRSTILTGAYSHTTGIYLNGDGGAGGFPGFHDGSTVATWLSSAGYRTGLFGKYLNHYEDASYIPPGWTHWRGLVGTNSEYYDYDVSIGGRLVHHGHRPRDYATDVFGSMTAHWIRSVPDSAPLFAYFAPPAPTRLRPGTRPRPRRRPHGIPPSTKLMCPTSRDGSAASRRCRRGRCSRPPIIGSRSIGRYWRSTTRCGGSSTRSPTPGGCTTPSSCSQATTGFRWASTDSATR
jgi:hypothetical protein